MRIIYSRCTCLNISVARKLKHINTYKYYIWVYNTVVGISTGCANICTNIQREK